MARVLITTVGSSGDIHPFIAIARELKSRGHAVEMLVNPYYHERILAEGIAVRALGTREDLLRVLHHPDLAKQWRSPQLIIRELISGSVGPTIQGVEESIREFKPDVLVRHHISLGSRWVAQREKIPVATCTLAPVFWFNQHDPAVHRSVQMEQAPPWLMRLRLSVGKVILRFLYDRPLNVQRRAFGFAPLTDQFRREVEESDSVLGLWSPAFRAKMEGDPAHAHVCGFCTFDRAHGQEAAASEVQAFLRECGNEAPLVFTLGTSVVHHHNGFYELAAEAIRKLGRRAVLLVGDMAYAPKSLPPGVAAFAYAPYSMLFDAAGAIVHHGGVGTTAAAMRAGKPTVIIPFANDEFDNARRAKVLGCSVTLHARKLNVARLEAALREATSSQRIAEGSRVMGEVLRREHGAVIAAERIEALVQGHTREGKH